VCNLTPALPSQLLQVFDSWAGELTPHDFRTFSLPYLRKIASGVRDALSQTSTPCVPLIVYAKGALGHSLPEVAKSGYDVIGLDWQIEPQVARKVVELSTPASRKGTAGAGANEIGHRIALQGNMDPAVLFAGRDAIEREVERMCRMTKGGFGGQGAWIANLGHGITPGVDPQAMRFFLECVHKYSREVASAKDDE
jgi:uroporphyrinogen decarboxylase